MKKLFLPALSTLIIVLSSAPGHAISLSIVPPSQSVAPGSIATVTVNISGLSPSPGAPSLGAFDFNIVFNSSILSFNGAAFGGNAGTSDQLQLGAACLAPSALCGITPSAGSVNLFEVSGVTPASALDAGQTDAFILATLRFNAIGGGISTLSFGPPPGSASPIFGNAQGNPLIVDLATGSITVQSSTGPTPEPNSLLLLALGVSALFLRRLAKSRK